VEFAITNIINESKYCIFNFFLLLHLYCLILGSNPVHINHSIEWERLKEHAEEISSLHLRDLLKDAERCEGLRATHGDIIFDYSRELVTFKTMVWTYTTLTTHYDLQYNLNIFMYILLFVRIYYLILLEQQNLNKNRYHA
jgi:hypothetical protein